MDRLIGDFRRHEQELIHKGASGDETMPYTGTVVLTSDSSSGPGGFRASPLSLEAA